MTTAAMRTACAAFLASATLALLAACGGGSPSAVVPLAPAFSGGAQSRDAARSGADANVELHMVIRGPHPRVTLSGVEGRERRVILSGVEGPNFVSPSTRGVLVQAYAHGKHTPKTLIAQNAVNVSSGSKACGGKKGYPRTCSVTIGVPATGKVKDDFVFTSYDAAPVKGTFTKKAKVLGLGSVVNQKIVAKKNNVLTIYLGGVIAGLSGQAGFASLPADGSAHTLGFVIDPTDYGDNPITAGKNDPFANPIVVSLREIGGSGHAGLSLDGGAAASSVTVKYSTQSVQLEYDGGGSAGYGIAVTLKASKVDRSGGASERVQVSPLFVSNSLYTQATHTLNLSPGLQPALAISERDAPSTQDYTAQLGSGCYLIATVAGVTGGGASASAIVTAGTLFSSSACTVSVSDGTSTIGVTAANGATSSSVSAPASVTIGEYPIPMPSSSPLVITAGSDGALWFTEGEGNQIGRIPTTATVGSGAQITQYPIPTATSNPIGIAPGPDGALWFAELGGGKIGRIPTTATPGSGAQISEYGAPPNNDPYGLAPGADGNIWYGDWDNNVVSNMTTGGVPVSTWTAAGEYEDFFVTGPDGAMWFTDCGGHEIGRITTGSGGGVLTEAPIPTTLGSYTFPFGITVGSDGNIWFVDAGNDAIGKAIVTGTGIGTISEIALPAGGRSEQIVPGPDGALWFADCGNGAIGRIPTNATSTSDIAEYSVSALSTLPWGISEGPDGALWFTDAGANAIGRVALGVSPSSKRGIVEHAIRHFPVAGRAHVNRRRFMRRHRARANPTSST